MQFLLKNMSANTLFILASLEIEKPQVDIVGIPINEFTSGRKGADQAPRHIRLASHLIETYSPYLNLDLEDFELKDSGDLRLSPDFPLESIQNEVRSRFQSGVKPAFFGGDHSISVPIVKAAQMVHPELKVLILDAHCDLRDQYQGSKFNHACAARRIAENIGWENLKLLAPRSGTKEEFVLIQEHNLRVNLFEESLNELRAFLIDKPVYISLDLDVFDPSLVPGVSAPEPGGISYFHFLDLCQRLKEVNIIGFDIVELCPPQDPAGISALLAASCARELILLMID